MKKNIIEAGDEVDIDLLMEERKDLDYKNIVNTVTIWIAEVYNKKTKEKIGIIQGTDFGQIVLEWNEKTK